MKKIGIITACLFLFQIFGTTAQDDSGFPEGYLENISKAAPHIPQRPNRFDRYDTEEEASNHRIEMGKWASDYPEEFKQAVLLDSYLYIFTPSTTAAADKTDPWPYPEFMRYPVTASKPEPSDSVATERSERHFNNMTQHWYFLYDKEGYVQRYGALPVIAEEADSLRKQ